MKFGKQLEEYEQPEWRGHYINYKYFKQRLSEIKELSSASAPPTPIVPILGAIGIHRGGDANFGERETPTSATAEWQQSLHAEALRVGDFVRRGIEGLDAQLKDLDKMNTTLIKKRSSTNMPILSSEGEPEEGEAEEFLELRVLEAVGLVAEGSRRLRNFAELNHAAIYKILKKHDKVLGSKKGLSTLFPKFVGESGLGELSRFDSLDEELRRLSSLSSQTQGLNASAEVARLAAGLGGSRGGRQSAGARRTELVLSFFLGCSSALFLCIGVLLALPAPDANSFSTPYFLTPMPVFRVVFSILLALWCMGAVAKVCDNADINHMFIMSVDPRCRLTPGFFFSRAATLTTLWILVFSMYVVDYKWEVLPPIWSERSINQRSSFHFVMYPVTLLLVTIVGIMWPSKICRNRYKAGVLRSVFRTVSAPFYPVDFADNILGDILTSLAKPLQDVPAAVCYLVSPHPQPLEMVARFAAKGDTCGPFTHHVLTPIIGGLPYVFRAMQCLRRYRDTKEARNLWNFGKYIASLSVVILSSMWPSKFTAIAIVSAVATVYAGIWDVKLDWGLHISELFRLRRCETAVEPKVLTNDRALPPRIYLLCGVLDILARSTWVLTLMPITIVSHNIVGRVVLVSVISSIEILRRSMWAVLRIEHEQLANASGFRALLWVPSKIHLDQNKPPTKGENVKRKFGSRFSLGTPLLQS